MANQLSLENLRRLRFHNQFAANKIPQSIADIVHHCGGLQSQELPATHLAIRARSNDSTVDAVKQAHEIDRSFVLTWTMRGTMHLISTKDVHWQLGLMGQATIKKTERRYKQLDLDEATRHRTTDLIQEMLNNGNALTRTEIAASLEPLGIPVNGQAIHHLVRYAALAGIICFGPEREKDLTYVLLDDWIGKNDQEVVEEQAVVELTRRYFQAYAPATLKDYISWSGLSSKQAKIGFMAIADDLISVETPNGEYWLSQNQLDQLALATEQEMVRLLPRFDNYLLAYQSRDFMVADAFAKQIHPGGGIIRPALVINGSVKGIWRIERKRRMTNIVIQPFTELNKDYLPLIEAESSAIGHFLNEKTQMSVESSLS